MQIIGVYAGSQEKVFQILQKRHSLPSKVNWDKMLLFMLFYQVGFEAITTEIRSENMSKPVKFHVSCLFSLFSLYMCLYIEYLDACEILHWF